KGSSPFLFTFSYPDFRDFQSQGSAVADLFGFMPVLPGLSADGKADQMLAAYVTGNYFSALNVHPALGRLLLASEENRPGDETPVVLGYAYWQKRFAGNPGVIGKEVRVNGKAAVVVGVVPKTFLGTLSGAELDAYLPMSAGSTLEQSPGRLMQDRDSRIVRVMARLRPGVSFAQARSAFAVIAARLAKQYPATDKDITIAVHPERFARPQPLPNDIVVVMAGFFLLLAGLLLLLACMNVANVLLARAAVRRREMGLRAALGAGRVRLIRQVLTEPVLLGLLGGAGGLLLGNWFNPGNVSRLIGNSLPIRVDLSFDWHVFVYTFGAALFSGIAIGLWPAWRASREDLRTLLQDGGRSDTAGIQRHRLRNLLVGAQVAGSLILLVIAGLLVRSLQHSGNIFLGFDSSHVLNVSVDPHQIGYDEQQQREFYRLLKERVKQLPGVESVSLAFGTPMGNINVVNAGAVTVEGKPISAGQQPPTVFFNNVDAGYLRTLRLSLLRGRWLSDADNEKAVHVAVINQAMADKFWPHEDAISKRFSLKPLNAPEQHLEVVGITATGKYVNIAEDPTPFFYMPLDQYFLS